MYGAWFILFLLRDALERCYTLACTWCCACVTSCFALFARCDSNNNKTRVYCFYCRKIESSTAKPAPRFECALCAVRTCFCVLTYVLGQHIHLIPSHTWAQPHWDGDTILWLRTRNVSHSSRMLSHSLRVHHNMLWVLFRVNPVKCKNIHTCLDQLSPTDAGPCFLCPVFGYIVQRSAEEWDL